MAVYPMAMLWVCYGYPVVLEANEVLFRSQLKDE